MNTVMQTNQPNQFSKACQKQAPINSTAGRPHGAMTTPVLPDFDAMPARGMVRVHQLVRDPRHPSRPVPLPFSRATLWRKVADGSFPKPIKLGERTSVWRVEVVRAWMDDIEARALAGADGGAAE